MSPSSLNSQSLINDDENLSDAELKHPSSKIKKGIYYFLFDLNKQKMT